MGKKKRTVNRQDKNTSVAKKQCVASSAAELGPVFAGSSGSRDSLSMQEKAALEHVTLARSLLDFNFPRGVQEALQICRRLSCKAWVFLKMHNLNFIHELRDLYSVLEGLSLIHI